MTRGRKTAAIATLVAATAASPFVYKSCSECEKLEAAKITACTVDPHGKACEEATAAWEAKCKPMPSPSPTPSPTPIPTPTPTHSPTPSPSPSPCNIPPDEGWSAVVPDPGSQGDILDKIIEAQQAIGDRCGNLDSASVELLVVKLATAGVCSRRYGSDMLMVRRSDAPRHEEWDVVLSNGCWSQQWGWVWLPPGTSPPPTPPTDCDPPMPLRVWDDNSPHWRLDSAPLGNIIDHTATYLDQWDPDSASCPRCTAWGYGWIGGKPRCTCPTGDPGTPARICRENWLSGGLKTKGRNGAECKVSESNPWWLIPNGGNCRFCSIADPRVCGGWY